MVVDQNDIDARVLTTMTFAPDFELADLTNRKAGPANVTQEVIYAQAGDTQATAALIDAGGLDGVFWRSNRDLQGELTSIGLFGPAGAHTSWSDSKLRSVPIPKSLARAAVRVLHYEIVPTPLASAGFQKPY